MSSDRDGSRLVENGSTDEPQWLLTSNLVLWGHSLRVGPHPKNHECRAQDRLLNNPMHRPPKDQSEAPVPTVG